MSKKTSVKIAVKNELSESFEKQPLSAPAALLPAPTPHNISWLSLTHLATFFLNVGRSVRHSLAASRLAGLDWK